MDMNALLRLTGATDPGHYGRDAVEAVKAGEDMLLMPADLDAAYKALLAAVRSGEIPESRIDESVRKLLLAKAEVGLNRARFVDINALPQIIASPAHVAFGQLVADSAVTLVRDNGHVLPLAATAPPPGTSQQINPYLPAVKPGNQALAVVFSDDVRTDSGRTLERELRARIPEAQVMYVDNTIAAGMAPQILSAVDQAQKVILAAFVVPTSGKQVVVNGEIKNTVDLTGGSAGLISSILDHAADKTVMVALGSPYVASSFPAVQNYLCTFSGTPGSEVSAVKALFGEIPIRGHLPVTIPGIAARGFGIPRPASAPARSSLFDGGPAHYAKAN
jgi:beta-N-acetylhexosaminidase